MVDIIRSASSLSTIMIFLWNDFYVTFCDFLTKNLEWQYLWPARAGLDFLGGMVFPPLDPSAYGPSYLIYVVYHIKNILIAQVLFFFENTISVSK